MLMKAWLMGMLLLLAVAGEAWAQGGAGGWWNRVAPTTPDEKAYVREAGDLRAQIWQKVAELQALQAQPKPPVAAAQAKQAEMRGLRSKLVALNVKNRALIQQMALRARQDLGAAPGGCPLGGPGVCSCPCNGVPGSACPFGGPGMGVGRSMGGGRAARMGAGRGLGAGRGMGCGAGCPWR